jgi:hypothetical protein
MFGVQAIYFFTQRGVLYIFHQAPPSSGPGFCCRPVIPLFAEHSHIALLRVVPQGGNGQKVMGCCAKSGKHARNCDGNHLKTQKISDSGLYFRL